MALWSSADAGVVPGPVAGPGAWKRHLRLTFSRLVAMARFYSFLLALRFSEVFFAMQASPRLAIQASPRLVLEDIVPSNVISLDPMKISSARG